MQDNNSCMLYELCINRYRNILQYIYIYICIMNIRYILLSYTTGCLRARRVLVADAALPLKQIISDNNHTTTTTNNNNNIIIIMIIIMIIIITHMFNTNSTNNTTQSYDACY